MPSPSAKIKHTHRCAAPGVAHSLPAAISAKLTGKKAEKTCTSHLIVATSDPAIQAEGTKVCQEQDFLCDTSCPLWLALKARGKIILNAEIRKTHLHLRKPAPRRPSPRMLRSHRRSQAPETFQAETRRAWTERPRPRQPVRMPRSMRARPEHRRLPRRHLVRTRCRSRRRRDHRLPHHRRSASRTTPLVRFLPEYP